MQTNVRKNMMGQLASKSIILLVLVLLLAGCQPPNAAGRALGMLTPLRSTEFFKFIANLKVN